jgi:signal peptidase I
MAVRHFTPTQRRALATLSAIIAILIGSGMWLARSVRRVSIEGGSMAPALLPGDRLLVIKPPQLLRSRFIGKEPWMKPGEVVAVRDPRHPARILVKRVASVDRKGRTLEVLGDASQASSDSRTFGPVPLSSVLGRAVYRYAPDGRTGRGPWARSTIVGNGESSG